MAKNYTLTGIEPAPVWKYFYEVSQIPRDSGNCGAVTDYLLAFCKENGIKAVRDEALNVIAWVDATPGYENASPVILQSHSDMVCIKDPDSDHDFTKDPIPVYAEGDVVTAEGTTLGGDDGIGVAFMMALMVDKNAPHPALECVFTADEETDMNGGVMLDYSQFKAKYYLNIDGFGFAVGSAGEIDTKVVMPRSKEAVKPESKVFKITISGLQGGHGGNQALEERANAITLLNRILVSLRKSFDYQIIDLKGGRSGGNTATAIPTNASAVLAISEKEFTQMTEMIKEIEKMLKKEYDLRDPNIQVTIASVSGEEMALDVDSACKVLQLMTLLPDGLRSTNQHWDNTMGSTSNIGVLETREDEIEIAVTMRSTDTKRFYLLDQARTACEVLGLKLEVLNDLPAWEPTISDEWMDMIRKLYSEYQPYVLPGTGEIGFFATRIPGLNLVSLTPSANYCHSTNEYLSISECQYFWEKMLELLKQMKDM